MSALRFAIHGAMLADAERNQALAQAVEAAVEPGCVVVDVGTGSGFLALLAARAGARRVYALEDSAMAMVARRLVAVNGFADVIAVVQCSSFDFAAPEPADVVLCETLGFAVLDEGFRSSLVDARQRLLRPGGRLVPAAVEIRAVPVMAVPGLADLNTLDPLCGFDFSPLVGVLSQVYQRAHFPAEAELAEPARLWRLDCHTMPPQGMLECAATFTVQRPGVLAGCALWFEAEVGPGPRLHSRSAQPEAHWGQAFLAAARRRAVAVGERLAWRFRMEDRRGNFRLSWSDEQGEAA